MEITIFFPFLELNEEDWFEYFLFIARKIDNKAYRNNNRDQEAK